MQTILKISLLCDIIVLLYCNSLTKGIYFLVSMEERNMKSILSSLLALCTIYFVYALILSCITSIVFCACVITEKEVKRRKAFMFIMSAIAIVCGTLGVHIISIRL